MSLAEDTRVNVPVPFPTLVMSSGPITLAKKNGIWSVGLSYTSINEVYPPTDAWPSGLVLVWDVVEQSWVTVSLATLASMGSAGTLNPPQVAVLGGVFSNSGAPHKWVSSINVDGSVTLTQPTYADITGAAPSPAPNYDTAAGTYNVTTEQILLVNKVTPAANAIQLPVASTRNGVAIVIKDYAGNSVTYPITILPNAGETIDTLASLRLASNFGFYKLIPLPGVGWYMSA